MTSEELKQLQDAIYIPEIKVDFVETKYARVFMKQLDTARYLLVTVTENGATKNMSDWNVTLRMLKADGTNIFNSSNIQFIDDGRLLIEMTEQMLAVSGCAIADLEFNKGDDIYKTMNFHIDIESLPYPNDTITSTNEYNELNSTIFELNQKEIEWQNAENQRVANEDERITNEDKRISSESERIDNENIRVSNENTRTDNENTRISAENIRNTNENNRIYEENIRNSNEDMRKDNETIRQTNETTRQENEVIRETNETDRKTNEKMRQSQESQRQTDTATAISNVEIATQNANNAAERANTISQKLESLEPTLILKNADGKVSTENINIVTSDQINSLFTS